MWFFMWLFRVNCFDALNVLLFTSINGRTHTHTIFNGLKRKCSTKALEPKFINCLKNYYQWKNCVLWNETKQKNIRMIRALNITCFCSHHLKLEFFVFISNFSGTVLCTDVLLITIIAYHNLAQLNAGKYGSGHFLYRFFSHL